MKAWYIIIAIGVIITACSRETAPEENEKDLSAIPYAPLSFTPTYPDDYPRMEVPENNPITVDGVNLGRHLFYDPILSLDSTLSCSSCHLPQGSFTDNKAFSEGVDGSVGARSSMSLLDVAFAYNGLFWDGRAQTLEEQALLPVEDPIELHNTWPDVIDRFKRHRNYDTLFRKAFGIIKPSEITKELAAKAIAQFERTLVTSGNSKYDRRQRDDPNTFFTEQENIGRQIFFEDNPAEFPDGQCFHCHNRPLFTTNEYVNNGIDPAENGDDFPDLGRFLVTGEKLDKGKFKVPTIRNMIHSAPYMHDGRFETLDEVLDHYLSGGHPSIGKDVNILPVDLTNFERESLKAFILTLTDDDFHNNPAYKSPF